MDVFEESEQLARVPLFSKLDKATLKMVAFTSERIALTADEFLFHKGENSDSVYLILDGTLNVVIEKDSGEEEVIVQQHKNNLTGEMGVIRNLPRAASIKAAVPSSVLKIEADVFMNLLLENSSMSLHVMRELSDRLDLALKRESGQTD